MESGMDLASSNLQRSSNIVFQGNYGRHLHGLSHQNASPYLQRKQLTLQSFNFQASIVTVSSTWLDLKIDSAKVAAGSQVLWSEYLVKRRTKSEPPLPLKPWYDNIYSAITNCITPSVWYYLLWRDTMEGQLSRSVSIANNGMQYNRGTHAFNKICKFFPLTW